MLCPSCGKEVPDDSKFCLHCGSQCSRGGFLFCPSCGKEVPDDSKFCLHCGAETYATIFVYRKPKVGMQARFSVFINGQEAGKIRSNASEGFVVKPGNYSVYIKQDWAKSNELSFSLNPGEAIKILGGLINLGFGLRIEFI